MNKAEEILKRLRKEGYIGVVKADTEYCLIMEPVVQISKEEHDYLNDLVKGAGEK